MTHYAPDQSEWGSYGLIGLGFEFRCVGDKSLRPTGAVPVDDICNQKRLLGGSLIVHSAAEALEIFLESSKANHFTLQTLDLAP